MWKMSVSIAQHSESDGDDENGHDIIASHPLLLQSSSSTPKMNSSATSNSNLLKQNEYAGKSRFLFKLRHLTNIKRKLSGIKYGLISFLMLIYIYVLTNWSEGKPLPQIFVDVPPVDVNYLGSTGKHILYIL